MKHLYDASGPSAVSSTKVEWRVSPSATKLATLLDDLGELRDLEPDYHAVIFTRYRLINA